MSQIALQFLMDYLHDEFKNNSEVRLRPARESRQEGVIAKTESREYFFPTEWVEKMRMDRVAAEVSRMRAAFPD